MSLRPLLPILLALAACGGRSNLLDDGAPAEPACAPLTEAGPVVALPLVDGLEAHGPALVPLGDGPQSAIAFGLRSTSDPGAAQPIADVFFDPWGAWPPDLAEPRQIVPTGGGATAVAPHTDPSYALVTSGTSLTDPSLLVPNVDAAGPSEPLPMVGGKLSGAPLFLVEWAHYYLPGLDHVYAPTQPSSKHLLFAEVVTGGGGSFDYALTCGLGSIPGDGLANGDGFFAALSTTAGNVDCSLEEGMFVVGPPTQVQITTYGGQFWSPIVLSQISYPDVIARVRLVPRASGAWLLVQTRSGDDLGAVEARALLASGQPDGSLAPAPVAPAGSRGFAAAPLGDGFAAAWIAPEGSIDVALFDASGARRATASIPIEMPTADPVTLLISPDASALLVAWSDGAPSNVRLARFGCLNPP